MMKTLTKLFLTCLFFANIHCPITNKLFLKSSRVKGDEAKFIINNRLASLFVNDISTGSNDSLAYDIFITTLAGVQEDKIYSRHEVEGCASKIFLAAVAIDQPNITANRTKKASAPLLTSNPQSRLIPPILCNLKPKDEMFDIN